MSAPCPLNVQANGFYNERLEAKFAILETRLAELEKELVDTKTQAKSQASHAEVTSPATNGTSHQSIPSTVESDRYVTFFRTWDTDKKEFKEERRLTPKEGPQEPKGRVLTYRQVFDEDDILVDWDITIEDKNLLEELKTCYHKVCPTDEKSWAEEKQTFSYPFRVIIWSYDELELRGKAAGDDDESTAQRKADVRQLLQIVRNVDPLVDYFQCKDSTPDRIGFKFIWTLFPLGTEFVSTKFLSMPQIFRLYGSLEPYDRNDSRPDEPLELEGWHYDHTGTDYVRAIHEFEIKAYDGEKLINSLEVYPIKYHADAQGVDGAPERLRTARIEDGNKFIKYCELEGSERLRLYDDMVMAPPVSKSGVLYITEDGRRAHTKKNTKFKRMRVSSEVIVDPQAWYRQFFELPLGDSAPYLSFENQASHPKHIPLTPTGDWVRLCPPRIFGFLVKERVPVQVKISAISDPVPKNDKPFNEELQLASDSKVLLRALVENHFNQKTHNQQMDIVAGKGNTLVILLHGAPGLGKTLTAETLAKATGKPLLTTSVSDIGVEAESVETNLERLFERAARWEAILLIDEADTFLEERRESIAPEKNALVTVMLRILEYYNGIIILTTNRLMSLDPAVQSRIHLALYFDNLSTQNLVNIFNDLLGRFNVNREAREGLKDWFEVFAQNTKTNGREIRNLVHSAVALARSRPDNRVVSRADFNAVLDKLRSFHNQLDNKYLEWKVANTSFVRK